MRIERVRVVVAPWFFRIPGFRRYHGYAFWRTILLKRRADVSDDLLTHELCHIWQGQHRAAAHVLEARDDAVPVEPVRDRGAARGRRDEAQPLSLGCRPPSLVRGSDAARSRVPTFIACCGARLLCPCLR